MIPLLLLALFLLISAIACASFAGDRSRNEATWFIIGFLTGPIGLLVLLTQTRIPTAAPVRNESVRAFAPPHPPRSAPSSGAVGRVFMFLLVFGVIGAILGMGLLEGMAYLSHKHRTYFVEQWHRVGDSLLRVSMGGPNQDSLVVQVARNQVMMYRDSLSTEMGNAEQELSLATQGYREAAGAETVLVRAKRVFSSDDAAVGTLVPLELRDQQRKVEMLTQRMATYRKIIASIDATVMKWTGTSS